MLVGDTATVVDLLQCPRCGNAVERRPDGSLACSSPTCDHGEEPFPTLGGKPVLIDFSRSVLDRETTLAHDGASVVKRHAIQPVLRRVADGTNHYAGHSAQELVRELETIAASRPGGIATVLVVGGGEVGSGAELLHQSPKIRVISFDIYVSPHVTFVADGHDIPVKDGSIDAVWMQGILECVVDPDRVVAEIRRVLAPQGLFYASAGFLWPVAEAGYDYRRFSASGLRWLFRDFDVLAMGATSGPGAAASLAIRYLFQSLFRNRKVGHALALPFTCLRLLDRWTGVRRGMDGAAALFFYGRLREHPIDQKELVRFYEDQEAMARAAAKTRR